MRGLLKEGTRIPLTWWRWPKEEGGWTYRVVCSAGHASMLQHNVEAGGALVAPKGCAASLHCGTCGENLPLQLEGWTDEINPPLPIIATCDDCKTETRSVGGWTSCAYGLLCPRCWKARDPR